MSYVKLPILRTSWYSWQDGLRALIQMPSLAIIACAVIIFQGLLSAMLWPGWPADRPVSIKLLNFGLGVATSFFVTPVVIAVHRYVLLAEITDGYSLDPSNSRFRNFFFFGVLLQAMFELQRLSAEPFFSLVLVCVSTFIGARLIMLFPAIAIDGYGANLLSAWQNSSGRFWRIWAMTMLVLLPILLLVLPLAILHPQKEYWRSTEIQLALAIVSGPVDTMGVAVAAALASHFYRAWARRPQLPAQP